MYKNIAGLLLCSLLIVGCSKKSKDSDEIGYDVDMYNEALVKFQKDNYRVAAEKFEEIEENHPYSKYSAKSQIMAAFCYYQMKDYASATKTIEMFLYLRPINKYVAYALYLNGRCNEKQVKRVYCAKDYIYDALESYQELCDRYPDTDYTKNAKIRIKALNENLATSEYNNGMLYLKRKFYGSAVLMFNNLLAKYPDTHIASETRYRVIESYISMGMIHFAMAHYKKMTIDNKWKKKAQRKLKQWQRPIK